MAEASLNAMLTTHSIARWANLLWNRKPNHVHGFHGGLTLKPNKRALSASSDSLIRTLALPDTLTVPLITYGGDSVLPLVEAGQRVMRGQLLAKGIPSPANGVIRSIEPRTLIHPAALSANSIIVDCDPNHTERQSESEKDLGQTPTNMTEHHSIDQLHKPIDFQSACNELLSNPIETLENAGIVGLGGAAFPTYKKLQPSTTKTRLLIINAAECEPEIACDEALMLSEPVAVSQGINLLMQLTQCEQCVVAIEDSMKGAINALQAALIEEQSSAQLTIIPTVYPTGAESPLIETITGLQIPHGSYPSEQGIVCLNVGTAYAVQQSTHYEQALDSRVISLGGAKMPNPCNVRVRFGTSVADVLKATNNMPASNDIRIRAGGPLSGFDLDSLNVPVTAKTNCILAEPTFHKAPAQACIRCGQCADVCPSRLQPQQLFWYSQSEEHDKCQKLNLSACIECGCCDLVCPSSIKLTETFRFAKSKARVLQTEQTKAKEAEARYAEREKRLAKREAARLARIEERKRAVKTPNTPDADRIKAALNRARNARKASKE